MNLLLAYGSTRWLDDVGTGSYTSHDLFWYRSSVAHNAPIVDGRTQASAAGHLLAWDERDDIGWASAEADALSPGVTLRRTVVVMADYLVDELHWRSDRAIALDLPLHADGIFSPVLPWQPSDIALPAEADAGYGFLRRIEAAAWPIGEAPVLHAVRGTERATVRWLLPEGASVWRAEGPGEPGESSRRFHAVRAHGREGTIVAIWDWTGNAVRDASVDGGALVVRLRAGARHVHRRVAEGWSVEIADNGRSSHVVLGGLVQPPVPAAARFTRETQRGDESRRAPIVLMPNVPWSAALGEDHWRQTEDGWADAARPTATVAIRDDMHALHLAVSVSKASPTFAGAVTENPLDNEHSDINSDGLQLHLFAPMLGEARWLVVPDGRGGARVTARTPAAEQLPLSVRSRVTADGWEADLILHVDSATRTRFRLDVLVNEIAPGRERRRGQLVLSGARGERAYLRGDRQPVASFLEFSAAHA